MTTNAELVKKFKKQASKQLQNKLNTGKLSEEESVAALEVLSLRGIDFTPVITQSNDEEALKAVEDKLNISDDKSESDKEPKSRKKREGSTTKTIEAFTDAPELKIGDEVTFNESRSDKTQVTGTIKRIFKHRKKINGKDREEARILGENGKRYFKQVKDFTNLPQNQVEEEPQAEQTETPEVAPKAEEAKA